MFEFLRNPELDFFGFFIPWIMVLGVIGFLLAWGTVLCMEKFGWTHAIWHLPLFFIALCLLFTFALGLILLP